MLLPFIFSGITSLYVSVLESSTFMAFSPCSAAPIRFGKSRYASGPTTTSTLWLSIKSDFALSAIHPNTPRMRLFFFFLLSELKYSSLWITFCSAFSLIEQVFTKTASASLSLSVRLYPSISIIDATTSVSAIFIWQP